MKNLKNYYFVDANKIEDKKGVSKMNSISINRYKGDLTDEWYTPVNVVFKMLKEFPPNKGDTIICPFDTESSNFVKILKEQGYHVIYGITDFMEKIYEFDYLITNPPFSEKDNVIARCIEIGKPSVLILPVEALGGVKRHKLYAKTKLGVYIPTRRINYISIDGKQKKSVAHHSIFIKLNNHENTIQFECLH